MFERILVAVDGSARSQKTIGIAVDLAGRYDSVVTVLHVREYERYEGSDVDMGPPISAEQLVDDALSIFQQAGVEAKGVVRRAGSGDTPEQIVDVSVQSDATLLILGSRGMSEWKSLLLGGVASKVVGQARCPVLLVR
jgi:nucleotide-binding universal stress UspA family protein